jgi:hypothetical protein
MPNSLIPCMQVQCRTCLFPETFRYIVFVYNIDTTSPTIRALLCLCLSRTHTQIFVVVPCSRYRIMCMPREGTGYNLTQVQI